MLNVANRSCIRRLSLRALRANRTRTWWRCLPLL